MSQPGLWTDEDLERILGHYGAFIVVTNWAQVFLNAFHFGMDLQEAVNAPRFSTWSFS